MNFPSISVIIPTCDRPIEFLMKAIGSVLNQSLKPSQVLVVDNGVEPVLHENLPREVELINAGKKVGASYARNYGASEAKGSYLAFLDDDDWWDSDFLKEAFVMLSETSADCVYGRKDRWIDGKQSAYKCVKNEDLNAVKLLKSNPGVGGINLLVKAAVFKEVGGFDINLRAAEDRSLALDLILAGKSVVAAPKAVSVVRDHKGERLRDNSYNRVGFYLKYKEKMSRAFYYRALFKLYRRGIKYRVVNKFKVFKE